MMTDEITIHPIYLESNQGLGNALRVALKNCKNELIARMDSDDVSQPYRFERQLDYLKRHPDVDMVGGNITEFIGEEENMTGQRCVPETNAEIRDYMKKRCAFNHMSVMYKKKAVKKAGGYRDWFWNEDYYLWIRMMLTGATFANVQDNIVNVRVGNEMSARRGGMQYFESEKKLQGYMLHKGIIRYPQYFYNTMIRFVGEVILPNSLRAKLFRFTREPVKNMEKGLTKDERSHGSVNGKTEETAHRKLDSKAFPPFSVAMSVYGKDNPQWFDRAMESLVTQTVKPDEIVLVVDGPVPPEIHDVINKYKNGIFGRPVGGVTRLKLFYLQKNRGHGIARRTAFSNCKNNIVAIMDADDICVSDRFEQQLQYFINQKIDIVGGDIAEFIGEKDNVIAYRCVPTCDKTIKEYMKKRCPFNQVTVMIRKKAYEKAGGYKDWYCDEDYYLWLRMLQKGSRMANTGTVLVNVRVGEDMYRRRGGWRYFRSEAKLQQYMYRRKIINFQIFVANVVKRAFVQLLLPNRVRGWVFKKFARENRKNE